jgi:23S rRNA-/tRNA-specific pseudouridylate synthase
VNVLHEDPELLAVHKPSGVVVIPARDEDPGASLHHTLQRTRGERLWVVHRIDRETSGVVLFARTASAHQRLNDLFATRAVEKRYVAFAAGEALPDATTVTLALHAARKGKMRPAHEGEGDAVDAVTGIADRRALGDRGGVREPGAGLAAHRAAAPDPRAPARAGGAHRR